MSAPCACVRRLFIGLTITSMLSSVAAELGRGPYTELCEVQVPTEVTIDPRGWQPREEPATDGLDLFIANKTGCRYTSVVWYRGIQKMTIITTFSGQAQWAVALRARPEPAYIDLKWNNDDYNHYRFGLGYNNSRTMHLERIYPRPRTLLKLRAPSSLLSPRSYQGFYIQLDNETLTVSKQCGRALLLRHNVSIQADTDVRLELGSSSDYGLKMLFDCPFKREAPCVLASRRGVQHQCLETSARSAELTPCKQLQPAGSAVTPLCLTNYYAPAGLDTMHCIDGEWTNTPTCVPECGTLTPDGTPLLIGARAAELGEVPWYAGVYTKTKTPYKQICGGSLVSDKLVISAAHCFWSNLEGQLPAAQFAVALGKLYRPWGNKRDQAQRFDVESVALGTSFHGSVTNFQHDVAVLVLAASVEFLAHVRPVCLDFDPDLESSQLQPGNKGKVAGWGLTAEDGDESRKLLVLELPYVSYDTCYSSSPETYRPLLTSDKICAGYNNGSTALCRGDSGSGLAFPGRAADGAPTRYFLRGVASTAPPTDLHKCNAHTYTSFTHLIDHKHFISKFFDN